MNPRTIWTTRSPIVLALFLFNLACSEKGDTTLPVEPVPPAAAPPSPPAAPPAPPAPPPGPPATIVAYSPTTQNGVVSDSVWQAPQVTVLDLNNRLLEGIAINCTVVSGGGSVSPPTKTSDIYGRAGCGAWTLGSTPGENTLSVEVTGVAPIIFSAAGRELAYFENYDLLSVGGIAVPRLYPMSVHYSGKIRFARDSTFDLLAVYGNQFGQVVPYGYRGRFERAGDTVSFFYLDVPSASGQLSGDLLTVRYLGEEAPETEVYRRALTDSARQQ